MIYNKRFQIKKLEFSEMYLFLLHFAVLIFRDKDFSENCSHLV